jgi:hypothetical protein
MGINTLQRLYETTHEQEFLEGTYDIYSPSNVKNYKFVIGSIEFNVMLERSMGIIRPTNADCQILVNLKASHCSHHGNF